MRKKMDFPGSILGQLIDKLTPLKNEFATATPVRKVEILWQIGDHLVRSGVKSSHSIGWKVQERSYISRDMLTKGYQVRMRWASQDELKRDLPTLSDYSCFRDLFPYVVGTLRPDAAVEGRILAALRNGSHAEARATLRELKGDKTTPRKRAKSDDENTATDVIAAFLTDIEKFVFMTDPDEVCGARRLLSDKQMDWFSRACLALAGAMRGSDVGQLDSAPLPPRWSDFAMHVPFLLSEARGSRFRSTIDRRRLATIASQLQWCKTPRGLADLRATRREG